MPHCLTLIARPGALTPDHAAAARESLRALGAITGSPDWLSEAEACDIPFEQMAAEQATAAARAALGGAPVDAVAIPRAERRKRLLLADMDSTIVEGETLDDLAAYAGLKDRIAPITARSMNGEIDFATALRERVAMLKGLPVAALERTWESVRDTPGAAELVATMRAHGATCALVSGGFTFFTGRVAARLGFDIHQANVLETDGDVLAGTVREPILDRNAKLEALKRLAAERGLPLAATAAIGDGANDLAMLGAAGLGVAWRAKPVVAAAARARLDHADLTGLLFAQGYRRSEFVTR